MKIAIVTGGNRGIGAELCRQLHTAGFRVYLTARDLDKAKEAAAAIGKNVIPAELNVAERESILQFRSWITKIEKQIDVLVNNAGIIGSNAMPGIDEETEEVLQTNFYGPIMLTSAMLDLLKKSDDARVINISSGMGAHADLEYGSYGAYRLSKAGLNNYTVLMAASVKQTSVKVVSMCPGWVKTDMGGYGAPRKVEDAAADAIWLITHDKISTGKFYRYKRVIPW